MAGPDARFSRETGMTAAYDWQGRELIDKDDNRVGVVANLYARGETPEWGAVRTGLFGLKETFVPITAAQPSGEQVRVPFTKDQIEAAPRIDPDDELSPDEESALYRHYSMDDPSTSPGDVRSTETAISGTAAEPPIRDDAMTRSEEELHVGTGRRERGRARLRKYVVTEEVRQRVPVEREEARIEREPITDENVDAAMAGPEISPAEHEVVLHEDTPVVEKQVVPKERVRLDKETRRDEVEVTEQVRKEQIEAEGELDR